MPLSWTRHPVRFFQHLLRESDAVGLDPARLVDEARAAGANGLIVMGAGFSTWYPSLHPSLTVNPLMQGDFLAETVKAAKAQDMRVLVRVDFSKGRAGSETTRPEDCVHEAEGRIPLLWDMPQMCPTGRFWQVDALEVLEEIATRYPTVDGFFFNYLTVARCFCHRCQKEVTAKTGALVPSVGHTTRAYELWRQSHLAAFMGGLRGKVQSRWPQMAFVPYHHVLDGWDLREMAKVSDLVSFQVSHPVVPNPIDPQPMWRHWAIEQALIARALKPEAAPLLMQTTSAVFASRQSQMPAARLEAGLVTVAAEGASTAPAVNGILQPGPDDHAGLLARLGEWQTRATPYLRDLQSPARIALIRSEESRLWGEDQGALAGRENGHVQEFRGMMSLLSDLRQPFAVEMSGPLCPDRLSRFDVVIVPGVSCISQADRQRLAGFTAKGGRVIVTGDSFSADEAGTVQREGASRQNGTGAYMALAASELREAVGFDYLPLVGSYWPGPETPTADLRLVGPFANNAPEFTVVDGCGDAPLLVETPQGTGAALTLRFGIGAAYLAHALPDYLRLMGAVVARHVASPLTGVPPAIRAILKTHPQGQVLHLINDAGAGETRHVDRTPLAGFALSLRSPAERVLDLVSGCWLSVTRHGDNACLSLEQLDGFASLFFPDDPQHGSPARNQSL